jgi:hypothetical protein
MVSDGLAKVTASISKEASRDAIVSSIVSSLKHAGVPVASSFRKLDDTTIIGFVTASRETRPVDSIADIAKEFRVLSSNMYLDEKDKTLWEMKQGASGKYLARNGVDNLESLVRASRVSPTGSIPRINRVTMATVEKHDVVAFVAQNNWTTDVDYGYCLATNANGDITIINNEGKRTVKSAFVIAAYQDDHRPKKAVKSAAATDAVLTMKDYYRFAYGDGQGGPGDAATEDYFEKIVTQIEEMSFA